MATATTEPAPPARTLRFTDFATPQELAPFIEKSNARAMGAVAFTWATVALVFGGVALWTNPLTILIGIALLGGRQLGLAALMHDCGHGILFALRRAGGGHAGCNAHQHPNKRGSTQSIHAT